MLVTNEMEWAAAKQNCLDMGARLMEIRSQEEYDAAQQFQPTHAEPIWLGASDLQTEGQWLWQSN